jgi:hypothetical protein
MQITNNILLVRPANFGYNSETAASNAFQNKVSESNDTTTQQVLAEFDAFVATLQSKGVNTIVIEDTASPIKPDAIFPNNWVTFHPDGTVILYPMCAPNRRPERRMDIIDTLKQNFNVTNIINLSVHEQQNRFLEGTGSIVFDHPNKTAYACLSPRTDKELFIDVCNRLHYKAVYFYANDKTGKEIYHTNVMMCIGEKFTVICLNSITDATERKQVSNSLATTGHTIIDIDFEQMNHFAGNMLAIGNNILGLSQSAFNSLTAAQKQTIEQFSELVPLSIPTIETIGGGSARCMMAEVFLPEKYTQ